MFLDLPLCLALWTLFVPRLDYCSYTWIISLPSPCWMLFADRRPTLALGPLFCLALYIPVCQCLTHACFRPLMLIKPCKWIPMTHVLLQNTRPHKDPAAFMNNTGPVCTLQDYYPSSRVSDHSRTLFKNI